MIDDATRVMKLNEPAFREFALQELEKNRLSDHAHVQVYWEGSVLFVHDVEAGRKINTTDWALRLPYRDAF